MFIFAKKISDVLFLGIKIISCSTFLKKALLLLTLRKL